MAADIKKSSSLPLTERFTLMFWNVGTGDYKPVTRVWLQGAHRCVTGWFEFYVYIKAHKSGQTENRPSVWIISCSLSAAVADVVGCVTLWSTKSVSVSPLSLFALYCNQATYLLQQVYFLSGRMKEWGGGSSHRLKSIFHEMSNPSILHHLSRFGSLGHRAPSGIFLDLMS